MPCKRALRPLSFSRLAQLSLFLGAGSWRSPTYAGSHGCLAVGLHSSLGLKEYTFRKEKTLSLNRSGDPYVSCLLRGDAHAYEVGWATTR